MNFLRGEKVKTIVEIEEGQLPSIYKKEKSVVLFWAPWCGPCKPVKSIFEELSQEKQFSKMIFFTVNVDNVNVTSIKPKLEAVPAILLYKNVEFLDIKVGNDSCKKINAFISQLQEGIA